MEWERCRTLWKPVGAGWNRAASEVQRLVKRCGDHCTELVFPPVCLVCGVSTTGLDVRICGDCEKRLVDNDERRCQRCAKPLPQYLHSTAEGCALCRTKRLRFQRTIALGTYGGELREVVLRMKQVAHEPLCIAAGELLAARIRQQLNPLPDLVLPVPMHWLRKLARGTNDSEVLADTVARQLQRPTSSRLLRCVRNTKKQGTLSPPERRLNVRRAYAVRRRCGLEGAHVLVVDDVMTTGATANELAKVLSRAGASQVSIAVVARGVGFE